MRNGEICLELGHTAEGRPSKRRYDTFFFDASCHSWIESLRSTGMSNEYSFNDVAVCREWLVHEDGALAYRLQDEESKSTTSVSAISLFFTVYFHCLAMCC